MDDERRIALFLDYENLALGARDHLDGPFELRPIADALAERGRVVVRRAYADWSFFDDDSRMLTRGHVELIEIPQRMGAVRKNAADIKMAVDAIEMVFTHPYISTYAIASGDSDFTPLVQKLRELNKEVIGIGVRGSTSALLPAACDEFLFYDELAGVDPSARGRGRRQRPAGASDSSKVTTAASNGSSESTPPQTSSTDGVAPAVEGRGSSAVQGRRSPSAPGSADYQPSPGGTTDGQTDSADQVTSKKSVDSGHQVDSEDQVEDHDYERGPGLDVLIAQTIAGLERSSAVEVTASALKRTLLRKDPTFNESDYGFRAFGELLRSQADRGLLEVSTGPSKGDPIVHLSERGEREDGFGLLRDAAAAAGDGKPVPLSGLKDQIRREHPDFTEKAFGYRSFLEFARAAETAGLVQLSRDADAYLISPA